MCTGIVCTYLIRLQNKCACINESPRAFASTRIARPIGRSAHRDPNSRANPTARCFESRASTATHHIYRDLATLLATELTKELVAQLISTHDLVPSCPCGYSSRVVHALAAARLPRASIFTVSSPHLFLPTRTTLPAPCP